MLETTVTLTGLGQVEASLRRLEQRADDLSPAWHLIEDDLKDHLREVFATEGAATASGRWPDLFPTYAAWKARYWPGSPLLTRSGTMRREIEQGDGVDVQVDAHALTIELTSETAIRHQSGAGGLPIRAILDPPEAELRRWLRHVERYVTEGDA